MSGMEENVKEITNKTLFLPPMEPSQKKAIEAGAKIVTEAVNKQFDKDKPLMLKPFHDTGPLLVSCAIFLSCWGFSYRRRISRVSS